MPEQFHRSHRHSADYYERVLRLLIAGNAEALPYKQIAEKLNAEKIATPTGQLWTDSHIRQVLKKLRAYKLYPSIIHQNLLELIFEGRLSMKDSIPLYRTRRGVA